MNTNEGTIRIVYGHDAFVKFLQVGINAQNHLSFCTNSKGPQMYIDFEPYRIGLTKAKERGIKIRYIAEINSGNINYCKQLLGLVELCHVDQIKSALVVSEKECLIIMTPDAIPITMIAVYSDIEGMVRQQQFLFDALWRRAVPAKQKIEDIQRGGGTSSSDDITRNNDHDDSNDDDAKIRNLIISSCKVSSCSRTDWLRAVYDHFFYDYCQVLEEHRKGNRKGIRHVTFVDRESIPIVKKFLNAGVQLRHHRNLPPINFTVSEKGFFVTAAQQKSDYGDNNNNINRIVSLRKVLFLSNEESYTNYFNSLFEDLWRNGVDVEKRIREIEEGRKEEFFEVIENPSRASEIYLDLAKGIQDKALLMLHNSKALVREYKLGILDYLVQICSKNKAADIRIICPIDEENMEIIKWLSKKAPSLKVLNTAVAAGATVLVVDGDKYFKVELWDEQADTFSKAFGLATYSNSKSDIGTFTSLFELIWSSRALNLGLSGSSEELEKKFINMIAHALRTPLQPLLGTIEMLQSNADKNAK